MEEGTVNTSQEAAPLLLKRSQAFASRRTVFFLAAVPAFLLFLAQPFHGMAQETGSENNTTRVDESSTEPENVSAGQKPPGKRLIRRSAIFRDPVEILREMGLLGWIFLVLFSTASIIALWFAIERFVVLRRGRVIPRPFVERFLQHLEQGKLTRDEALQLCEQSGSPVAAVFSHGIRKWGKPSVEVEQAIIDGGERQVSLLRKHLRVLNGVATVTPLMGLLGTVCGMILAFDEIAVSDAMGKAEKLGSDIGLALMTTAAGLTIAIPSLITYMYLAGRVDGLVMEMDLYAQDVVHLISAEALTEKTVPTPRVRKAKHPSEKRAV